MNASFTELIRRSSARVCAGLTTHLLNSFDKHMQEVVRGTLVALAVKIAAGLLTFLFHVVLSRALGTDGAGRFLLALTCVTLAIVIGKVGLDSVLVRYVATSVNLGRWHSVVSIRRSAMLISVPISCGIALLLFFSANLIADRIFRDHGLSSHIRIMALAVPFMSTAMLHAEMIRGLKRIGTYQVLFGVIVPGTSIVALWSLLPFFGEKGAFIGYVFAAVTAMLAAVTLWRRALPKNTMHGEEITPRELLRSGLPLLWAASMFFVNGWVATIALGIYGAPKDVALFNAANKLAWLTSFILLSVNSIAGPKFAEVYRTGSIANLERMAVQTTRLMMLVASPVIIACMTMPSLLLGLFGQEFRSAAAILQILVLGQMANVASGSVGQLLIMTGHEKDLRNVITSSALLNALLATVLAAQVGLQGVACAVAITTLYTSIICVFLVRRRLNIETHIFRRLRAR